MKVGFMQKAEGRLDAATLAGQRGLTLRATPRGVAGDPHPRGGGWSGPAGALAGQSLLSLRELELLQGRCAARLRARSPDGAHMGPVPGPKRARAGYAAQSGRPFKFPSCAPSPILLHV